METFDQVLQFVSRNPIAWFATAEDSQPHVRGLWMWRANENGFFFHTGTQKRFSDQLRNNPNVEFAFYNPGAEGQGDFKMVRVTGTIEILDDPNLEQQLFADRPWLSNIKQGFPDDKIFVFRIPHGQVQYWDMSVNCREKEREPIVF